MLCYYAVFPTKNLNQDILIDFLWDWLEHSKNKMEGLYIEKTFLAVVKVGVLSKPLYMPSPLLCVRVKTSGELFSLFTIKPIKILLFFVSVASASIQLYGYTDVSYIDKFSSCKTALLSTILKIWIYGLTVKSTTIIFSNKNIFITELDGTCVLFIFVKP